jgi:hypothetical protein
MTGGKDLTGAAAMMIVAGAGETAVGTGIVTVTVTETGTAMETVTGTGTEIGAMAVAEISHHETAQTTGIAPGARVTATAGAVMVRVRIAPVFR